MTTTLWMSFQLGALTTMLCWSVMFIFMLFYKLVSRAGSPEAVDEWISFTTHAKLFQYHEAAVGRPGQEPDQLGLQGLQSGDAIHSVDSWKTFRRWRRARLSLLVSNLISHF